MWKLLRRSSYGFLGQKASLPFLGIQRMLDGASSRTQRFAAEATIEIENNFQTYDLDDCPETTIKLTKEDAVKFYIQMQSIRRFENVCATLYKAKAIRGFCHLYIGQEACAVGMKASMRDQDNIITAYRCHGWTYLMGVTPFGIVAELTGRIGGCSRGKGGSMHMYAPNFFGGNGIVGAQVPLGTGVALACKLKKNNKVCFALYGDGAANQGQVFEAYNMACLWKLPCIFVCENNHYAMGTKDSRGACCTDYYTRGHFIPGIWVDGMNLLAVRSATKLAIDYALKSGPLVMELHTYRYMGHSMSDPGTSYRSREEVQEVRAKRDPIMLFRDLIIKNNLMTDQEAKDIDAKIKKEMDDVGEKAKTDKEVELKELTADIYSKTFEKNIRGPTGYTYPHIQINKGMNH